MSAILKKFTVYSLQFTVFILTFFLLLVTPAFAQSSALSASPLPASNIPLPTSISPTSPIYTDLLVHNFFHTFSCLSVGSSIIGQPCLTYQAQKDAQGAIQSVPVLSQVNLSGGLLGTTSSLIGALYMNPPVRTIDYLASVGESFGIVKEAHAQVIGSGQAVLNPILKLWQVSRNIAYLFMIIIFVVIGLMVMFRQRINPQTVITAQAALPGLVIGLILITFSYFFAALLSDTAFIGTNLVGYYFSTARGASPPQNLVKDLSDKGENVLTIFSKFSGIITSDNATDAVSSIWGNFTNDVQGLLTALAMFIVSSVVTQATEAAKILPGVGIAIQAVLSIGSAIVTATAPQPVVGKLLSFIATIILIYAMLKLLLRLVNNYLSIIFLTLTAPFQFLAAALPGRQDIATAWILNMLSNVLAFPAVLAVFYFVAYILGQSYGPLIVSNSGVVAGNSFIPQALAQGTTTIVGTDAFPLFGGMNLDFIRLLLAFGALVASPAIPDIIARTIGRVGVAGQLIGQEISGSYGAGRGYAGQFQQGVGNAAGYIGRGGEMWDTPGWEGSTGGWKRVGSTDPNAILKGARPGGGSRTGVGIKNLWGRIRGRPQP